MAVLQSCANCSGIGGLITWADQRLFRVQAETWLPLSIAVLQAYSDYNDVMNLTEELVSGLVKAVKGTYKIQYHAGAQISASTHLSLL